jgi:hypothetical protein
LKSGKPKQGAVAKNIDRAAPIHQQIAMEQARHARKVATLLEQTAAASTIGESGQRYRALVKLRGQQVEETARHRDRLATLNLKLGRIWR